MIKALKVWWWREQLKSGDWRSHCAAAEALARLGDARAVEPLIKALKERRSAAAAQALGLLKDARAVEPLIEALQDFHLRDWAKRALMNLGPLAVEPLIKALEDAPGFMPYPGIEVLAHAGDTRAVEPLIKALGSPRAFRRAAAKALAQLDDPYWKEVIRGDEEGGDFSRLASYAGPRAVEPLIKALHVGDKDARRLVAEKLIEIARAYPECLERIREVRNIITRVHFDGLECNGNSSDCTTCHGDRGIGMAFPF